MKLDSIKPFFKGKRKLRTIIFGVLPTVSLLMLIVSTALHELLDREIPSVVFVTYRYAALPYYLIGLFAALLLLDKFGLHSISTIGDILGYSTFSKFVLIVIPAVLYLILISLFLYYCYYYRNKRIKAYKHIKKALTVIWTVIAVPSFIFLYWVSISEILS